MSRANWLLRFTDPRGRPRFLFPPSDAASVSFIMSVSTLLISFHVGAAHPFNRKPCGGINLPELTVFENS